jgi:hypothetical protein
MSDIQRVYVENSVSWGGSVSVALGVGWYVWGLYGFWWGLCYGFFWPVWFGYRAAAYLLGVGH